MDDRTTEVRGQQKHSNDPATTGTTSVRQLLGTAIAQTALAATNTAPYTNHWALRTRKQQQEHRPQRLRSTGCSGRQNAMTRRTIRREERVIAQCPVKKPTFHALLKGLFC